MTAKTRTTITVATWLWLAAVLFFALALSRFLELPGRQALFVVVVGVGGTMLWRIYGGPEKKKPTRSTRLLPARTETAPNTAPDTTDVLTSMPEKERLTPREAREWLDSFLVRQQKKQ